MAKPKTGRGEVLARMHAASLNSRELVVSPTCMQAVPPRHACRVPEIGAIDPILEWRNSHI